MKEFLTLSVVLGLFHYSRSTGKFFWLKRNCRRAAGDEAGTTMPSGYRVISISGRRYLAHRLVWLMEHGSFPQSNLDHINRDPSDNRISNLRECNQSQNTMNSGLKKSNTSGHIGVSWLENKRRWFAQIMVNRKTINLGYFRDFAPALEARRAAEQKYFGEFAPIRESA